MYLIKLVSHGGKEQFSKFQNFEQIKKEVIHLLDVSGWSNKTQVDLRSVLSCLNYLYNDYRKYKVMQTTSLTKFLNW